MLGGTSYLLASDLLFDELNVRPLVYAGLTWVTLRYFQFVNGFVNQKGLKQVQIFSLSFLVYLIFFSILGLFSLSFPMVLVSLIGLVDFFWVSIYAFRQFLKLRTIYFIVLGFLSAVFYCLHLTKWGVQTPWFAYLADAGIGYIDTFRDAAVIKAWHEYRAITHGTHGLLFTPYHSLFAQFHAPFLGFTKGNAFLHLQYYTYIVGPTIFSYGILTLIDLLGHPIIRRYRLPAYFFFFTSISAAYYSLSQRSTMMATFIAIAVLPLLIVEWKNIRGSLVSWAILIVATVMMVYARAFHGLILLATIGPLVIQKGAMSKRFCAFIASLFGLVTFVLFYGSGKRNDGLYFDSVKHLWQGADLPIGQFLLGPPFIVLLVSLSVLWGTIWLRKFSRSKSASRLMRLMLFAVLGTILAALKARTLTDVAYLSIFMAWIIFYAVMTPELFECIAETVKRVIRLASPFGRRVSSMASFKLPFLLKQKATYGVLVIIILLGFDLSRLAEIKPLILNYFNAVVSLSGKSPKPCDSSTFFCDKYHRGTIESNVRSTWEFKMGSHAIEAAKKLNGVTSVYVPRDNKFWTSFPGDSYTGLYFMANFGMPMIFGLNSDNIGYGYPTVESAGGRLKALVEIGDERSLCESAQLVDVNNILVFDRESPEISSILECSKFVL